MMPTEATPPLTILQGVRNAASAKAKSRHPSSTNMTFLISVNTCDLEILRLSSVGIFSLHLEIGIDEGLDVTVHDALDIAGFIIGPVIFDHGVGLEDIAADL